VVTFNSISGSGHVLTIYGTGRSTQAGTGTDEVHFTFNSDTASNYARQSIYASITTAAGDTGCGGSSCSTTYLRGAELMTAGDTANESTSFIVTIPLYAGTSFYKTVIYQYSANNTATSSNLVYQAGGGVWRSTSAITRIDLTTSSNWAANGLVCLEIK
jgi:hypothetical protein